MQIVDRKNIEKRILYYWSKMYASTIKSGSNYEELEKGIVILISDYNLEKLKEIEKYITKWNIREEETPKVILTDMLEIYIIELSKVKEKLKGNTNKLNSWLDFINNPEVKPKMENKEIEQARKILQDISSSEHERYLAELREKHIMDQKAIRDAGYDKGIKEGLNQGLKEGLKEGLKRAAKKLKEENVDIKIIIKTTGLTKEQIENL